MSNEINYEDDLAIDQHSLDTEWLRQSKLMHKYSVLYADLSSFRDEAKEELARIDAEIDLEIRTGWEAYGFEVKPTEAAIKSVIVNDERHIAAVKELNECSRKMIIAQGAKTALEHKKSALERLTSLVLSGYWAEPRITKEAKNAIEEDQHDAHRQQLADNPRIRKRSK